jgi:hypothetical protein
MRSLGRAWVEPDGKGGWCPRRGRVRVRAGALTQAAAGERMLELVRTHHVDESRLEADEGERRRRGITFRELSHEWLHYLEFEKGVQPSTLTGYRGLLAEPGLAYRRRRGETAGRIMEQLGRRPALEITLGMAGELVDDVVPAFRGSSTRRPSGFSKSPASPSSASAMTLTATCFTCTTAIPASGLAQDDLVGVTILNARWLLEHEGRVTLTIPSLGPAHPGCACDAALGSSSVCARVSTFDGRLLSVRDRTTLGACSATLAGAYGTGAARRTRYA